MVSCISPAARQTRRIYGGRRLIWCPRVPTFVGGERSVDSVRKTDIELVRALFVKSSNDLICSRDRPADNDQLSWLHSQPRTSLPRTFRVVDPVEGVLLCIISPGFLTLFSTKASSGAKRTEKVGFTGLSLSRYCRGSSSQDKRSPKCAMGGVGHAVVHAIWVSCLGVLSWIEVDIYDIVWCLNILRLMKKSNRVFFCQFCLVLSHAVPQNR